MSLKNSSLDQVRINVCNNQSYVMTAALPFTTLGNAVLQGFATAAGDGGKAIFTSNLTSAINFTYATNANAAFIDLIFVSTAASSTRDIFQNTAAGCLFLRCVFHGGQGSGMVSNAGGSVSPQLMIECESYDCNKSNTAGKGGFQSNGITFLYNCYSHDHSAGTNAHGFSAAAGDLILVNCIADTCAGSGASSTSAASGQVTSINCNYYNNGVDGVKLAATGAQTWAVLINNNFLLNVGKGINATTASQGGILYNNGRGAGTQANGGVDVLSCIVNTSTDITYASNVTPWNAPTTGDFRTTLAAAKGVGRGVFTETDGSATGTISYPDIGAAQAIVPAASGGLRLAGSGGLAA